MRFIIRTSAVAILALLSACSADDPTGPPTFRVEEAGHNAVDRFSSVDPVSFEVTSPCNNELITFEGTDTYQMTWVATREVLDLGAYVLAELQSHVRASGVGPASGATYTIDDVYHESFNSPSGPAAQVSVSAHGQFRIVSDDPALSFTGHVRFHAIALPSGESRLLMEVERVLCRA